MRQSGGFMQSTINIISFTSKYNPEVKNITKQALPALTNNPLLLMSVSVDNPSEFLTQSLKAQVLFENPVMTLNKVVDAAKTGEAKNWSYMTKPEGGDLYKCNLKGKEYTLESSRTGNTYKKDDKEYYEMAYLLTVKTQGQTDKTSQVAKREYIKVASQLETLIFPQIEAQYGLDKGLEVSGKIAELAKQTLKGDLQWEQIESNVGFGDTLLSINASGAVKTQMSDGTKVTIIEKVEQILFSTTRESFLGLEKEGLPPQLVKIVSKKEEAAYNMLGAAFDILGKEEALNEAQRDVDALKDELQESISRFLQP